MNTPPKSMDWPAAALSVIRHSLTTLGGASVAYTACADQALNSGDLVGAAAIMAGMAWGVFNKYWNAT